MRTLWENRVWPLAVIIMIFTALIFISTLVAGPAEGFDRRGRMGPPGMGENKKDRKKRAEEMKKQAVEQFEKMCEFLELKAEQKKEARKLFDERQKKMKKVTENMQDRRSNPADARDKMGEIFTNYREKLSGILNEAQKAKLEKWIDDRQGSGGTGSQPPN